MSYRILSQDCLADNNSHATGLNNNDLIVGPSGAGKTRGYVLPNILQCSESFIVADTKNSLRAETEAVLRQNGYKVLSLDLCGGPSSGYNPLDYIRLDPKTNRHNEQDIMAVSAALIPIETPRDPFWEFSARIYLESIIGYVLESLPEEEHTMDSVVRLSREIGTGRLSKLMDELAVLDPDSFAARRYSICRDGEKADRTNACVLMFLAEKLAPLDYAGARAMKRSDLTAEGQRLNHCVGMSAYFERHLLGHQMVFFIRKVSAPDKPYFTAEIDTDTGRIIQLYGFGDCSAPKEVRAFTEGFCRKILRWKSMDIRREAA